MAKILIIKLGALGDVVMSTSLIKQIQAFHSTDKLFVLTSKPFDTIFNAWDDLTTHVIERKGLGNGLSTIMWMRENRFKYVYDLQSNDRSGLYCAFSGISKRIGNHPRYPYNVHPTDAYIGQCHIYTRMLAVLRSANIPAEASHPCLPATHEEKQRVSTWIKENDISDNKFIIIHAGGSKHHPEKRWPFYAQLAQILSDRKKTIVWVGGGDDLEINKHLSSISGINAGLQFTFSELAELGRHASFAITNDSGPMHILSCSGIPVCAFFGPTNWKRAHAVGQEKFVITLESTDSDQKYNSHNLDLISSESAVYFLEQKGLI